MVYELVVAIDKPKLISIKGPYEASVPDISVFRKQDGIMEKIPAGRKLIADRGYNGESDKLSTPSPHDTAHVRAYQSRARARHETFNNRIKAFGMLKNTFRSDISYHKIGFEAICVLVQYDLENGHPLYQM